MSNGDETPSPCLCQVPVFQPDKDRNPFELAANLNEMQGEMLAHLELSSDESETSDLDSSPLEVLPADV